MNSKEISSIVNEIKNKTSIYINNEKYEDALFLISFCAKILYNTNICYYDKELECMLKKISNNILAAKNYQQNDVIVFYDGFGIDRRGLAQIYLKKICETKKVFYLTYIDRKKHISKIVDIVKSNKGEVILLERKKNYTKQIYKLFQIISQIKPSKIFCYSIPDDIVITTVLHSFENLCERLIINLTDHAFWIGADCIDKCIEFREYGASISSKYRKIDINKIFIIPFYPIIDKEQKFNGFPFIKQKNSLVLFSGGSLYKTVSEDNKFYQIVRNILSKYKDIIFWYAGSGDYYMMNELVKDFPTRVYYTNEREDLFQILNNCNFYVNTYPFCGGLMFQYAALAGLVPLTLKCDDRSSGFLINQKELNVEYTNEDELYKEFDSLYQDINYRKQRSIIMKNAVISENSFNEKVEDLLNNKIKNTVDTYEINDKKLVKWYLDNMNKGKISELLIDKLHIIEGLKFDKKMFIMGLVYKIKKRLFHTNV